MPPSLRAALFNASLKLSKQHIQTPRLDAEILLANSIKKQKEFLYAHPEYALTKTQSASFQKLIARRASCEPVAYIINKKEFYGYDFYVDKRVLIPRPETEALVEGVLALISKFPRNQKIAIADIGTGSGCIIICLALKFLKNRVPKSVSFFAVDASKNALAVARRNARAYGFDISKPPSDLVKMKKGEEKKISITFSHGNLLEPILNNKSFITADQHIIVANLPYITPKNFKTLAPEITRFEPRKALLTPTDDPDYWYKKIKEQIKPLQTKPKWHTFFEKAV